MIDLDRTSVLYIRYLETAVRDLLPWAEAGARMHYRTSKDALEIWNTIYDGYFDKLLGKEIDTTIGDDSNG